MEREEIYKRAIGLFGINTQIDQCIEELSELIKALNKYRRHYRYSYDNVWDDECAYRADILYEIADVKQMIEQLYIIFDVCPIEDDRNREKSLKRLRMAMDDECAAKDKAEKR